MGCDGTCDFCREMNVYEHLEVILKSHKYSEDIILLSVVRCTIKVIKDLWQKSEDLEYEAFLRPCPHCGKDRIKR